MANGVAGFITRIRLKMSVELRTDAELLRDYAQSRSDESSAEIVRRFAPMVWKVCLRTVGQYQLAEDAFQAVFLVLVRRAGTIHPPVLISGWLYTVAVHTSLRARAMADRNRKRIGTLSDNDSLAPPSVEPVDPEALRMLDEEIARLPEKFRAVVVLCELEGLKRSVVATRLKIAEGTLSSRLATARKQLATRLRGRGVVLGISSLATMVATGTAQAVPTVLAQESATITLLANGVIRAMYLSKLKLIAVSAFLIVTLGFGLASFKSEASEPRPTQPHTRVNAPAPKIKKEGLIVLTIFDQKTGSRVLVMKPSGETVAEFQVGEYSEQPCYPRLSGDGTHVVICTPLPVEKWNNKCGFVPFKVLIFEIAKPEKPLLIIEEAVAPLCVWGSSSKTIYLSEIDPEKVDQKIKALENTPMIVSAINLETQKKTRIGALDGFKVVDISDDGNTAIAEQLRHKEQRVFDVTAHLVTFATKKTARLASTPMRPLRLSPDAKKAFALKASNDGDPKNLNTLVTIDLNKNEETEFKLEQHTEGVSAAVWSPVGSRMLLHGYVEAPQPQPGAPAAPRPVGGGKTRIAEFTIRNADGSEPKVVYEVKHGEHIIGADWR